MPEGSATTATPKKPQTAAWQTHPAPIRDPRTH